MAFCKWRSPTMIPMRNPTWQHVGLRNFAVIYSADTSNLHRPGEDIVCVTGKVHQPSPSDTLSPAGTWSRMRSIAGRFADVSRNVPGRTHTCVRPGARKRPCCSREEGIPTCSIVVPQVSRGRSLQTGLPVRPVGRTPCNRNSKILRSRPATTYPNPAATSSTTWLPSSRSCGTGEATKISPAGRLSCALEEARDVADESSLFM